MKKETMKLKMDLNNKLKVLITVVVALLITIFLSRSLFYPNSTELNPEFTSKITKQVNNILGWPKNTYLALKRNISRKESVKKPILTLPIIPTNTTTAKLSPIPTAQLSPIPTTILFPTIPLSKQESLQFEPLTPGVFLATDKVTSKEYVKIEKGTLVQMQEYTLVDGRKITVVSPVNK